MCWWSAATARRVGELGVGIVMSTGIGRDELRTLTGQAAQLVEVLLASMTSPALPGGSPVQASRYATRPGGGWHIDRSGPLERPGSAQEWPRRTAAMRVSLETSIASDVIRQLYGTRLRGFPP